jgi:hypothetical protein
MSQTIQLLQNRRTHYILAKSSPVSDAKIIELVEEALKHTPTAFNSQNGRVVILLHNHHDKLWQMTHDALKAVVPADQFPATAEKITAFADSYGTLLFFEDQAIISNLQEQFPLYAHNFPVWSQQSNGILQNNIWVALAEVGLGASLQHYSELIESAVREAWQIPDEWKLVAQMPFGQIVSEPDEKQYQPIEQRVKVFA